MSGTERLIRFAAATLPPPVRARYREEWLADAAGADEVGVSRIGVVVGALLFSATLDRTAPQLTGIPIAATVRRRAQWSIALLASAGVFTVGSWMFGGYRSPGESGAVTVVTVVLAMLSLAVPVVAVLSAVGGVIQLWRAALSASPLALVTAALGTGGVVAMLAFAGAIRTPIDVAALGFLAFFLLVGAGACGLVVAASAPVLTYTPVGPGRPELSRPRRLVVVLLAALILFAVIAVGAVDLLVWAPMALAPGYELVEIYAALSEGDRVAGLVWIALWTLFWLVFVVALAIIGLMTARKADRFRIRPVLVVLLTIAATIVFFQPWSGFSLGMSISDTLPPYRGGMSAVGFMYGFAGQLALVAAILLSLAPRRLAVPAPA